VANRRITELQEIAGTSIAEDDLFTVVHVGEVDPTLKNRKITLSGTKDYLNVYYLPRTGGTVSGAVVVQGNLTVSGSTIFTTATFTGTVIFNSLIVQSGATVSGTLSGATITGDNVQGTNVNGVLGNFTTITGGTINVTSGNFLQKISGVTITGESGVFTSLTAQTLTGVTATFTSAIIASGTAALPSLAILSDPDTGIYSPGDNQIGIVTSGLTRLNVDGSGRIGLGGITAPTAALELAGQTVLSNSGDAVGVKTSSSGVKTYPASGGTFYGSAKSYEISNTTAITSPTVTFVGDDVSLRKSTDNLQDIDGFSLIGRRTTCIWTDANTLKNYTQDANTFFYFGCDANSRTSSQFTAVSMTLAPITASGTQTIATVTSEALTFSGPGGSPATHNITDWFGGRTRGFVMPNNAAVGNIRVINMTNGAFYDTTATWGVSGTGTTNLTATITNLYGLRLRPPANQTGLTITNNWGLYQEWSSAKNWFAAESNQFPNVTTTASSANVFVDSADSNRLYRSTSSSVYKKNVESLDTIAADKIFDLRPVWYRSKCQNDRKDWSWYGLIAEEVAQIDPRFVHYGYQEDAYELVDVKQVVTLQEGDLRRENGKETEEIVTKRKQLKKDAKLVPNGIAYERLTVPLIDIAKRQKNQIVLQQELINDLLARVSTLETRLSALEGA
jgi:hypothetical protein